ncbi:MAG TPA: LacI family DNA-binding transcriptional regulator [Solirubrobacter sp.]|nr:LacI family DNA-binding transcriptional regulator [Solirubrobacter sp.]
MSSPSRPTLADVASLAGVARSTASMVINGVEHARVAEDTRARVLAAVDQLGYRPNAAARGLRTQRTHLFGFVGDEIAASAYAGETITGAQDVAWAADHLLLIANTGRDPDVQRAAIDAMLDRQVDGLIIAAMSAREVDVEPLRLLSVPCVLLNCFGTQPLFPEIVPDDERGGFDAATLLLDAGHTRIAFINGSADKHAANARERGFLAAHAQRGLTHDPVLRAHGNWWPDGGYEHTQRLLALPDPPTAIFCANDRMAVGAYEALKELGLDVPGDVSVLGYDDMELAQHLRPALSTMALPHYEMGQWACRRLLLGAREHVRELLPCPPKLRDSIRTL